MRTVEASPQVAALAEGEACAEDEVTGIRALPLDPHAPPTSASTFNPITADGPMLPALLALALPTVAGLLARAGQIIFDAWLVGQLGKSHLAAFTGATFYFWLAFSAIELVTIGTNALTARYTGAREREMVAFVARTTLIWGAMLLVAFGALLSASAPLAVFSLDLAGATADHAQSYLVAMGCGLGILFLQQNVDAIFRGTGDTKTPMRLLLLTIALNATLAPIFVLGFGPIPSFELVGVPMGWYSAMSVSTFIGLRILARRGLLTRPDPTIVTRYVRRDTIERARARLFREALLIGMPVAAYGALYSLVYVALANLTSEFGEAPLAALGIGHRAESLNYMVSTGFSFAAATIVGQNLGARKPARAERGAWLTAGVVVGYTSVVSVFLFIFAEPVARQFSTDTAVIDAAVAYTRIVALSQWAMGLEIVFDSAFGGAGNSMPAMIAGVPLAVARVPIAWYLSREMGFGSDGIWWTITATTILKGVIISVWFSRGKWKTHLDARLATNPGHT